MGWDGVGWVVENAVRVCCKSRMRVEETVKERQKGRDTTEGFL
jgi:hypothetical protein